MDKKKIGIIIGIILLIVLFIISIFISPKESESSNTQDDDIEAIINNAEKESASVKEDEMKEFIDINMDTYLDYYNGNEQKIVLIARPTCHYCQIAEPIIHNVAYQYDLDIHYLNTDNFSEDDQSKLINSDEFFSEGFGTPLLLSVSEGSIKSKVDGLTDYEHYIEFFKENGYIE